MKKWYRSKMLWINGMVFFGGLISGITGENWLDGEAQLMALSVIDFVLRLITKDGLYR